jgi:hypothetical protein
MRQLTGNMTSVVRGMDKALESMNLERVCDAWLTRMLSLMNNLDIPCDG